MSSKTKSFKEWCIDNDKEALLTEWNHERNIALRFPCNPCNTKYSSPKSVHWKCQENHEWEAPIASRIIFNLKCPICHPKEAVIPVGSKYGCLTIICDFEEYRMEVAYQQIAEFEQDKANLLKGIKKDNTNIISPDSYDRLINSYRSRELYKCQCKCGQTQYLDEFKFLEKKHRYCTHGKNECGLKKEQRERKLATYKRVYDESYHTDFLSYIHESLKVLECVDANYEQLVSYTDKRKRGGGTYKVYKRYRCRCYLCGKEHIVKSSSLSIHPPSDYGFRAYDGYYSEAFCDCHKISSFQWIVTKILTENKIPYRVEVTFPDLYGTKNVNLLSYDFSILTLDGDIRCLIECQGEQHYKAVEEFGGMRQFELQKRNDELKRAYAKNQGISLYEIPYTSKKYEKVVSLLKSHGII